MKINEYKPMLNSSEIENAIQRYIKKNYEFYRQNQENIVFLPILIGACKFFFYFYERLDLNIAYTFARTKTYVEAEKKSKTTIMKTFNSGEVRDKIVVVVDEIYDTGVTVCELLKYLKNKHCIKEIRLLTLLFREPKTSKHLHPDEDVYSESIINFESEKWLVGFGLDLKNRYRGLDEIYLYDGDKSKFISATPKNFKIHLNF